MKKLLLCFLLSFFFLKNSKAQELSNGKTVHSFFERNFGVAFISDVSFPMPGTSVLWGKTFINENIWDEARVFIGPNNFHEGVKAPIFNMNPKKEIKILNDLLKLYRND